MGSEGASQLRSGERWWNERSLETYRARLDRGASPVAGRESLGGDELALEALMLGLRTVEGIDLERFREVYGVDLAGVNVRAIEEGVSRGTIATSPGRLRLTRRGLAMADGIAASLEVSTAF